MSRFDHDPIMLTLPAAAPLPELPAREVLSAAAAEIVVTNPFRLERRPAEPSGAAEPVVDDADHIMVIRPQLSIAGIIGPPWEALVEGVPDRSEAVLVRAGDVLGDLRVRSVQRSAVIIDGPDTTWHLSIKRAWQ